MIKYNYDLNITNDNALHLNKVYRYNIVYYTLYIL